MRARACVHTLTLKHTLRPGWCRQACSPHLYVAGMWEQLGCPEKTRADMARVCHLHVAVQLGLVFFSSSFFSHQCSIMKQHWMERCYSRTCKSRVQAWLDMTDSMDMRLSLSPASMYFRLLLFSYVHIGQDVHFWFEVVILVLSSQQQKNFSSSVSVLGDWLSLLGVMLSAEPVCFARGDWLASLTHTFTTGHKESARVL